MDRRLSPPLRGRVERSGWTRRRRTGWATSGVRSVACLLLLVVVAAGTGPAAAAPSRSLVSRLGGGTESPAVAPPAIAETAPEERAVLPAYGPLAADAAGRLLMLVNHDGGYSVLRDILDDPQIVYRRDGTYGVSITIGPDGTFCIGTASGVDCVGAAGAVTHHVHPLLTGIVSIAFAPDGHLWVLRSTQQGTSALQLVRAGSDLARVDPVLTLRQAVQGFPGNGLAALPDGSVVLTVIEDGAARVLQVYPDGRFTRLGDFYDLAGGIAADASGTWYVTGVKRPQSLEEQRNPLDAVYARPPEASPVLAARFATVPGGTRLTQHLALGGDGILYGIRHRRVPVGDGPAQEMPVLWSVTVGAPGAAGPGARVTDFLIPYLHRIVPPYGPPPGYTGPLLAARGTPLQLEGFNFTGAIGEPVVLIGGVPAPVRFGWDGAVLATVPEDVPAGTAEVVVAIGPVRSDSLPLEVKTPEVPGWFQIGNPSLQALLVGGGIVGYNALIDITGTTDDGVAYHRTEYMEPPGLYVARLPNGTYSATFRAAYVESIVVYGGDFSYQGSTHRPVVVPEQTLTFTISDTAPVTVWLPDMLGSPQPDT